MKISSIDTFLVDAGWRSWTFVKVATDAGITAYGECSDDKNPMGVIGTIRDLQPRLLGEDPRAYEMRYWDMTRGTRQSPGGIAARGYSLYATCHNI